MRVWVVQARPNAILSKSINYSRSPLRRHPRRIHVPHVRGAPEFRAAARDQESQPALLRTTGATSRRASVQFSI